MNFLGILPRKRRLAGMLKTLANKGGHTQKGLHKPRGDQHNS